MMGVLSHRRGNDLSAELRPKADKSIRIRRTLVTNKFACQSSLAEDFRLLGMTYCIAQTCPGNNDLLHAWVHQPRRMNMSYCGWVKNGLGDVVGTSASRFCRVAKASTDWLPTFELIVSGRSSRP